MLQSPFAFLRGSVRVMAGDLDRGPTSDIGVQICGDAHLANFGVFGSPERTLLFDCNDFDETRPGPFEWDLKRLATSAVVLGRSTVGERGGVAAARAAVVAYRRHIDRYARLGVLDVWYDRVDADAAASVLGASPSATVEKTIAQARRHTSQAALPRLTALADDGARRIIDHPPLVTHDTGETADMLTSFIPDYRQSLESDRRVLLDRFTVVDAARKVVGVGSVGTRCFIGLLVSDVGEPLFLQVKEAEGTGRPWPGGEGQRVVHGQRLMQAASDIFLGSASWQGRDYYVRQLRDMKATVDVTDLGRDDLVSYLELCGWTLARAHARSGPAATIAGYVGRGDVFDEAITRFALAYADQTERDHTQLVKAVRSGRIEAETDV
jgi:uncharacterized protein (DUF2252 family)